MLEQKKSHKLLHTGILAFSIICMTTGCHSIHRTNQKQTESSKQTGISISQFRFMDAKNGWISGIGAKNWKLKITSDGGGNWDDITPKAIYGDYHHTYFYDKSNGWVTASSDYGKMGLWHTVDSGHQWKQEDYPANHETIVQFSLISSTEGWIATSGEPAMNQSQKSIYHKKRLMDSMKTMVEDRK